MNALTIFGFLLFLPFAMAHVLLLVTSAFWLKSKGRLKRAHLLLVGCASGGLGAGLVALVNLSSYDELASVSGPLVLGGSVQSLGFQQAAVVAAMGALWGLAVAAGLPVVTRSLVVGPRGNT